MPTGGWNLKLMPEYLAAMFFHFPWFRMTPCGHTAKLPLYSCCRCLEASGVAKGDMGACPPVVAGIFLKYNQTLNITRFVTIYGFVQTNIQHVFPACGASPTGHIPHRGSATGSRCGASVPQTSLLSPCSKFLATPLFRA